MAVRKMSDDFGRACCLPPLTPLIKPDDGIQQFVMDFIWRRLVSKVSIKGGSRDMIGYLNDI